MLGGRNNYFSLSSFIFTLFHFDQFCVNTVLLALYIVLLLFHIPEQTEGSVLFGFLVGFFGSQFLDLTEINSTDICEKYYCPYCSRLIYKT